VTLGEVFHDLTQLVLFCRDPHPFTQVIIDDDEGSEEELLIDESQDGPDQQASDKKGGKEVRAKGKEGPKAKRVADQRTKGRGSKKVGKKVDKEGKVAKEGKVGKKEEVVKKKASIKKKKASPGNKEAERVRPLIIKITR